MQALDPLSPKPERFETTASEQEKDKRLVEFAKRLARDVPEIAPSLGKYNITDEGGRIAIALSIAQYAFPFLALNGSNFSAAERDALATIVKSLAEAVPQYLAPNLDKFNIADENARADIAKTLAEKDPWFLISNFDKFNITDQNALIDLAKTVAEKNPTLLITYFHYFNITDQNAIIDIAKTVAVKSPTRLAAHFYKFNIVDENARAHIAKIIAEREPDFLGDGLYTFNITGQSARAEIVKKFLTTDEGARSVAYRINEFQLADKDRLLIFFLISLNIYSGFSLIDNFNLKTAFPKDVYLALTDPELRSRPEERIKILKDFTSSKKIDLTHTFKNLNEKNVKENPDLQNEILDQIALFLLFNESMDQEAQEWTKTMGLMDAALSLKNGSVRKKVIAKVFEVVSDKELQKDLDSLLTVSVPSKSGRPKGVKISREFYLKNAVLALLKPEIDDANLIKYANRMNIGGIRADALKMNQLLDSLCLLIDNKTTTDDALPSILERLVPENCTDKQLVSHCMALQGLLNLKGVDLLKKNKTAPFSTLMLKCFKEIVPLEDIEGFESKYENTLAKFRQFPLLGVYAGKLNSLPERNKLLEHYALFLKSTLNETFLETRQSLENNPHLQHLKEHSPGTLKDWHAFSSTKAVEELLDRSTIQASVPSMDYFKELQEKLALYNHLPSDKIGDLLAYFKDPAVEGDIRSRLENERNDPYAKIQLLCLDLIQQKDVKASLDALSDQLLKIGSEGETFKNDVEGFLVLLAQSEKPAKENPYKGLQLTFTNDPNDYLLCGTEVLGSCQSITKDAKFNKCLLSYLLDGKNRLIAIKDPTGKILNRSIIRLLWDDKQKQPTLFQEGAYTAQSDPHLDRLLYEQGKACALELNIPYASMTERSRNPLSSLGGPVPFEYSDAAGGIQENGLYTI